MIPKIGLLHLPGCCSLPFWRSKFEPAPRLWYAPRVCKYLTPHVCSPWCWQRCWPSSRVAPARTRPKTRRSPPRLGGPLTGHPRRWARCYPTGRRGWLPVPRGQPRPDRRPGPRRWPGPRQSLRPARPRQRTSSRPPGAGQRPRGSCHRTRPLHRRTWRPSASLKRKLFHGPYLRVTARVGSSVWRSSLPAARPRGPAPRIPPGPCDPCSTARGSSSPPRQKRAHQAGRAGASKAPLSSEAALRHRHGSPSWPCRTFRCAGTPR